MWSKLAVILTLLFMGCSDVQELEETQPAVLIGDFRAELMSEPTPKGVPVARISSGTVVWIEATADSDMRRGRNQDLCRAHTNDGSRGWVSCTRLSAITSNEAESRLLDERRRFENYVRSEIVSAAKRKIIESEVHPASEIQRIWVPRPLQETSGSSLETLVQAMMVGSFLGINKHLVDVRIGVFLDLDQNKLSDSRFEIQHVEIVGDEPTEGVTATEAANLLTPLLAM